MQALNQPLNQPVNQPLNQPVNQPRAMPIPLCNKNAKTPKTAQSAGCRCSSGVLTRTNTTPNKFYCK
jgi:hypothetical protein